MKISTFLFVCFRRPVDCGPEQTGTAIDVEEMRISVYMIGYENEYTLVSRNEEKY